jgi:hypothetical protein
VFNYYQIFKIFSQKYLIFQILQILTLFFEHYGIQAKITDSVEYVSTADPINLCSRWKIHLVFERGVGMSASIAF